jgi:muconolactone delta-isomerase
MKIIALEYESPSADPDLMEAYLAAEARRVLELTQAGIIREIYFRAEKREAVIMLECADAHEAHDILQTLPLVQAELIAFEIIPLAPYDGFARLVE